MYEFFDERLAHKKRVFIPVKVHLLKFLNINILGNAFFAKKVLLLFAFCLIKKNTPSEANICWKEKRNTCLFWGRVLVCGKFL